VVLIVCPAEQLPHVCRDRMPSHVISLASPGSGPPKGVAGRYLSLAFNDIVAPQPGLVAPDSVSVEAIVDFGSSWNEAGPLVVSCFAGVSRSTAAAFILACARRPTSNEAKVATTLRRVAPCATPNALMVALADRLLGRGGRMVAAIEAIGRGADYLPFSSFDMPLD
jgi:predicted protein tyrosine phosphatase